MMARSRLSRILVAFACFGIGLLVATIAHAQSSGIYDLRWNVQASGGSTLSSGPYVLEATLAQPEATEVMSQGPYALSGGYWPGVEIGPVAPPTDPVFANGFE